MRTTYALLSAATGALAQQTIADVVINNPAGVRYIARFETDLLISGRVLAGSDAFGIGASYHVQLGGLPEDSGPFKYHIHQLPVPDSGDCAETGGHLDPFGRTDDPACDEDNPETCEVGDLSGKYGPLQGGTDDISFLDLYTSLNPEDGSFIGNRSVVIHGADGARIACASFQQVVDETPVEVEPTPVETPVEEPPVETTTPEDPVDDECEIEDGDEVIETPDTPTEEPPVETTTPEDPVDDECEIEDEDEVIETPDTPTEEAPVEEAPVEEEDPVIETPDTPEEEAPVEEEPVEDEDPVIETPTSP